MIKKFNVRDKLRSQRTIYKVLVILIIIGIIVGFIYPYFLNDSNKSILSSSINDFFNLIKDNKLDTFNSLKTSLINNAFLCFSIWLLGISIVGIPIIPLIIIYKGFLLGFSFSSIINVYGIKGILGGILYVFPVSIVSLITTILLGFYGISFSSKLFKYLFLKSKINLNFYMTRYLKILCICIISFILCSLFEIYICPFILKLFTIFVK